LKLLAALALLAWAASASAEWSADAYFGAAYTPRSDMTLVVGGPGGSADHTFHDVKWDKSAEYGLRAGYWTSAYPWYGVGIDVFRFDADIPQQTVDTTIQGARLPATLQPIDVSVLVVALDLVRLRYRAALQPYFTAGPALFRVKATNRGNGELSDKPGTDNAIGYKIAAGIAWPFARSASLFGEYRYTHVRAEPVLEGTITGARVPFRFDLDTHHLVAGLSFGF
jgi:hypothetical protein